MTERTCNLCPRLVIAETPYCIYHKRALTLIKMKYQDWKYAFENISWERYLETILGLKETGEYAKAVARYELRLSGKTDKSQHAVKSG
jgi:hypothetical protein